MKEELDSTWKVSQEGLVGGGMLRFDGWRRIFYVFLARRLVLLTAVNDAVMMLWVSVLRLIEFFSHHVVQRPTPEEQNLLERFPEIPVQGGVYDGVEKGVGVAQPEKQA